MEVKGLLKVAISIVLEDGQLSHGETIDGERSEILEKIGEEIDDRVISIEIKKRPMQNAPVGEKITNASSNNQNHK